MSLYVLFINSDVPQRSHNVEGKIIDLAYPISYCFENLHTKTSDTVNVTGISPLKKKLSAYHKIRTLCYYQNFQTKFNPGWKTCNSGITYTGI